MPDLFNPDKYHRRSIRLQGYNYAQSGAYYITLCTLNRECLFGEVINQQMQLNEFGKILEEEWLKTSTLRTNVELDNFVIMPNHFHGIIVIDSKMPGREGQPVQIEGRPTRQPLKVNSGSGLIAHSLGAIVGQLKTITAKRINGSRDTKGLSVW